MNVRFYLKRPKSDTLTTVYTQVNYNKTSFKYYLPIKINADDWDFKSQRMKSLADKSNVEFNDRLEWIASRIVDSFYNYLNNNEGKMPTEEVFRGRLDKVFEKKLEVQMSLERNGDDFNLGKSKAVMIVDQDLVPQILDMIRKRHSRCIIVR